jgi:hypothetical protein
MQLKRFIALSPDPVSTRVARWFLFRPKIPIWVYFAGSWNRKCCYIFWSFGIFYDHWVYIMAFTYFIVIFFPALVYRTKKNLATLVSTSRGFQQVVRKTLHTYSEDPHAIRSTPVSALCLALCSVCPFVTHLCVSVSFSISPFVTHLCVSALLSVCPSVAQLSLYDSSLSLHLSVSPHPLGRRC